MKALVMWVGWGGEGFVVYGFHPGVHRVMLTKSSEEQTGLPVSLAGLRERLSSQRRVEFIDADRHEQLLDQAQQIEACEGEEAKIRQSARFGFDALSAAGVLAPSATFEDAVEMQRKDAAKYGAAVRARRAKVN